MAWTDASFSLLICEHTGSGNRQHSHRSTFQQANQVVGYEAPTRATRSAAFQCSVIKYVFADRAVLLRQVVQHAIQPIAVNELDRYPFRKFPSFVRKRTRGDDDAAGRAFSSDDAH